MSKEKQAPTTPKTIRSNLIASLQLMWILTKTRFLTNGNCHSWHTNWQQKPGKTPGLNSNCPRFKASINTSLTTRSSCPQTPTKHTPPSKTSSTLITSTRPPPLTTHSICQRSTTLQATRLKAPPAPISIKESSLFWCATKRTKSKTRHLGKYRWWYKPGTPNQTVVTPLT